MIDIKTAGVGNNPILLITGDPDDIFPLLELKQHLILYSDTPPGPKTARAAYDLYTARFGDRISEYKSTADGKILQDWTPEAQAQFEAVLLPALRTKNDWGYRFWDGRGVDSWQFLFHGYPPVSEPDMAGVFRFEFPWDIPAEVLLEFTLAILRVVPCLSGTAGYHLQGQALTMNENRSYDAMFGMAHRYWGAEAQNLDVTLRHARSGYKCVNWLTLIGGALRQRDPAAVARAQALASAVVESPHTTLLQIGPRPRLIDRNRRDAFDDYTAVAEALLPLQITEHDAFGGDLWDDDNTLRYLRRFTHLDEV